MTLQAGEGGEAPGSQALSKGGALSQGEPPSQAGTPQPAHTKRGGQPCKRLVGQPAPRTRLPARGKGGGGEEQSRAVDRGSPHVRNLNLLCPEWEKKIDLRLE